MIVVKMMGGLGNQMFTYAYALALRSRGKKVMLDTIWYARNKAHNGWELPNLFRLDIPICSEADRRLLGDTASSLSSKVRRRLFGHKRTHLLETVSGFDPSFLDLDDGCYLEGYWQSYLYHEGIESEIKSTFSFPDHLEDESVRLLETASKRGLAGVHVRRGDYLQSASLGGVCTDAYFKRAILRLREMLGNPLFAFFSDELGWCRERLGAGIDAVYVDWNRGKDAWRDMRLMTLCDGLILSNSSFSWWGARLGVDVSRPIISPDRWYGGRHLGNPDIMPPSWIKVSTKGIG